MSTITRSQFIQAAQSFARKHASSDDPTPSPLLQSWSWNEHPTFPGLGYLSRNIIVPFSSTDNLPQDIPASDNLVDEEPDDATSASNTQLTAAQLYVAYSPTYQVPALYFSVHHDNGTPLSLAELCRLPLFRHHALHGDQVASFSVQDPTSSMALLSQGDHPTLGTPCWYIHPCNTSAVVEDIMAEVDTEEWSDEARCVRWVEAWFMVIGNIVQVTF
ncbi:hypothetical protein EIP91_011059 [Steccherinum ochraceum]|uniref:Ubiquitin-like-conjugating enzyme ATG10 n=1 Tax=Steccherinum ochraceum TaxID=92696 RepID=A0A4R0S1S7_9APHY|nr:hypothetical protein EIP91_011059 [Steccherinum ochraceum]